MRLSDRELLLVLTTCVLTLLFARDLPLRAHRVIAQVAEKGGATETAERHLRTSIELAETGRQVRARADDHAALARLHRRAGRAAEADRELRRALVLLGHQERAHAEARRRIRSELIDVSLEAGRVELAQRDSEALLRATESAYGPDHPGVAEVLEAVAAVATQAGHLDRAEEARRRALEISESSLGPAHPETGRRMTALGGLLRARGRPRQAVLYLERSLAVLDRSRDPRSPAWRRAAAAMGLVAPSHRHLLPPLNELALAYRDEQRLVAAEATLRRALAITGPRGLAGERAAILINLAEVLRRRGSLEEAEQRAREALAAAEAGALDPVLRAAVHHVAAGVHASRGQDQEARLHLEKAARLAASGLPDDHPLRTGFYASLWDATDGVAP